LQVLARKHFGALFSLRKFWRANIFASFEHITLATSPHLIRYNGSASFVYNAVAVVISGNNKP